MCAMDTNPYSRSSFDAAVPIEQAISEFFRRVFLWMAAGLVVTGAVAYVVASSPALVNAIFGNRLVYYVVLFAPLGIVIAMGMLQERLNSLTAAAAFLLYSFVNGLTFSFIFMVYTSQSIASIFFVTAGMFGALSLYGFITRRDLSTMGRFFFMGLIGIIIASVVNIFVASSALSWAISVVAVVVFAGLTAWDTQKLREFALANAHAVGTDGVRKVAVFGALTLYLDFINMFLALLRLFGDRK
jgi:FtsH-binding integral membrane protein